MKQYGTLQQKKNYAPSQTVINGLTLLASSGITAVNHHSIQNNKCFKEMQTATSLLIFNDRVVSSKVLLLIAKIAATSLTLHTVCMYGKNLGDNGRAIAEALAKSHTIHNITISYELVKHGPKIAQAFTESPVISVVI